MSDIFFECPICGHCVGNDLEQVEKDTRPIEWAYTKTSDKNKWDAIKKSGIRMKKEFGYGIPEEEDLGSCITGIWEKK